MNNIFEGAYFGKPYRTRDGRKAVYLGDNTCWIEGEETETGYSRNGLFIDDQEHNLDIVSEWEEPLDEKELDEMAESIVKESINRMFVYRIGNKTFTAPDLVELVKAGYRKGKYGNI